MFQKNCVTYTPCYIPQSVTEQKNLFADGGFSSFLCSRVSVMICSETSVACTSLSCSWLVSVLQLTVREVCKFMGTCELSGFCCSQYMWMIERNRRIPVQNFYLGGQSGEHHLKVSSMYIHFHYLLFFPKPCDLFPCVSSFSSYAFFPFWLQNSVWYSFKKLKLV